jgi:hypothetical protein
MLLRGRRGWLLLVLLAAVAAAAAAEINSTPSSDTSLQQCSPPYLDTAVQHLSEIIQFRTVSDAGAEHHVVDVQEFHKLGAWLASTYAEVWQHFTVEKVTVLAYSYSLVYRCVYTHNDSKHWMSLPQHAIGRWCCVPQLRCNHLDAQPPSQLSLHQVCSGALSHLLTWRGSQQQPTTCSHTCDRPALDTISLVCETVIVLFHPVHRCCVASQSLCCYPLLAALCTVLSTSTAPC